MHKLKLFLTGINGWLHLFLFPVMISLIISLPVYLSMPEFPGVVLIAGIIGCGGIAGLITASLTWRKRGSASILPRAESGHESRPHEEQIKEL
jgi:hypothetical protein